MYVNDSIKNIWKVSFYFKITIMIMDILFNTSKYVYIIINYQLLHNLIFIMCIACNTVCAIQNSMDKLKRNRMVNFLPLGNRQF